MTATQHGEPRPGCAEVGWFSYFTFGYINPVVEKGRREQIDHDDAPKLSPLEDTVQNSHLLLGSLEGTERAGHAHPLLRSIIVSFWRPLAVFEGLKVVGHFLGLLSPLLMKQVLVFQESQNSGKAMSTDDVRWGLNCVLALVMLGLFNIFWHSQVDFFQHRLELRITGALRGAVIKRSVQGSSQGAAGNATAKGGADTPTVYNVISFDVGPNVTILWVILGMWLFPVQFVSTVSVIFSQVGWAVVPGICVVIVAKLVSGLLLFFDGFYRHSQLYAKDQRLGRCNEGFTNIRTLQMLTWVPPFEDRIMQARQEELRLQKTRLWLQKMSAALDYSLSVIVTLVTLGYFVTVGGGTMKASTALPLISLVNSLIGPFGQFPGWINNYLVWRSAHQRLSDFLGLVIWPPSGHSAWPRRPPAAPPSGGGSVASYEGCTLSWSAPARDDGVAAARTDEEEGLAEAHQPLLARVEEERFQLQGLDIQVSAGQVLVVVGNEGQGKTSVLQGLLGEMVVESGTVSSAAIRRRAEEAEEGSTSRLLPPTSEDVRKVLAQRSFGSGSPGTDRLAVPYAPQEVMLMSGTVRWNILFGARHEPRLYRRVLRSCALESDLAVMPAGDLTEVAQGGATLSGGQRARVGLARAVYQAALGLLDRPEAPPLVLLDDVLCALDRRVATEVCGALLGPGGLLAGCGVVVATADPWWLDVIPVGAEAGAAALRVAVLRGGRVVALGALAEVRGQGLAELVEAVSPTAGGAGDGGPGGASGGNLAGDQRWPRGGMNPQEDSHDEGEAEESLNADASAPQDCQESAPVKGGGCGQKDEKNLKMLQSKVRAAGAVQTERREEGAVRLATYRSYFMAVGPWTLVVLFISLSGIMFFQNCCNLWIAYWTTEDKSTALMHSWVMFFLGHEPSAAGTFLGIYGFFVIFFTVSNFAGHGIEIIGGVNAAQKIFQDALTGTMRRPFRWWDANPPGRVLNRFSEDVNVMDNAITNILGVIFGAVLYFVSHLIVLSLANPYSLVLLPFIGFGLEYFAKYYRTTVREVQRMYLVSMSAVYQEMVEAVLGQVTIRAFGAVRQTLCSSVDGLDRLQRISFAKTCVAAWIGLRMDFIGYSMSMVNLLYPVMQFYGFLRPQSAALVGFSISYSQDIVGILKQMILNFSELEMQLISVERLTEYSQKASQSSPTASALLSRGAGGLQMTDVTVTYREGLPPALSGVSLSFPLGEAAAIMGRTGAGKSSLLLSVMQLVPYTGRISVCGEVLGSLDGEDVRSRVVGVVPQQPALFEGSVRWNLDPKGLHADAEIWDALQAVGLRGVCSETGLSAGVATGGGGPGKLALSQGQRQMLCAARALLRRPRVVMLDEVSASLPSEVATSTVETLLDRFKQRGAAVLLVTHQQELLPLCDRVITVAGGHILGDRQNNGQATDAA